MEVSHDLTDDWAATRRKAGFGAAFAWELSGSCAEQARPAAIQKSPPAGQRAMPWYGLNEWDRLPWLPDRPQARHEDFDLALVIWVFAATFLVASASYSAGRASAQYVSDPAPSPIEILQSGYSPLLNRLASNVRPSSHPPILASRTISAEQLPPIDRMAPEAGQRVAVELSLAQAITSGPYDPSPEPNAPN
jgi:hypothetical protein